MCRRGNERLPATKVMTPEETRVAARRAVIRGTGAVMQLPFSGNDGEDSALLVAKVRCLKQKEVLNDSLRSEKE